MASILIVDDDEDGRKVLALHLARAGYAVQSAPNGREALVSLITDFPDLVILDAMMPEMTGVEFLEIIRSYLRWSTLPVVLLTAFPEGEHIDRAQSLGVRSVYLKANYKMADLLACIASLLEDPSSHCSGGIGA
jgi:CheY-like chemotaxis protein